MQIPYVLLQIILVPIITAIICALVGKTLKKNTGWIATVGLLYTTLLLILVAVDLWTNGGSLTESYQWGNVVFTLNFGFLADGLSVPVAIIMSVVSTALAVYSIKYMNNRITTLYGNEKPAMYAIFYALFMLLPVGLIGSSLSTNTIELFLFIESGLIPSFVILDMFGYIDRHRVAMMSFIWTQAGAALYLIGAIAASVGTGSFAISSLSAISGTNLGFWVCLAILIGFLIKMATFGFHVWLPHVEGEHVTFVAAILAAIGGMCTYLIARLLYLQMFNSFEVFSIPLMILAVITMIYGAYLTMSQDDVKRLFAYSTIGQTAYSLLGLASMTALGVEGGVFYFMSHILGKAILFSVAGILVTQTGVRSIKEMGGLAKRMPLTATLCIIGAMILSAMPPLSGFQSEWIMFVGIFSRGTTSMLYLAIAIIAIFAVFLTSVYTFWPAIRIFFGPLNPSMEKVKEAPKSMTLPLFALVAVSLIIGLFPNLIMHFFTSVI